MRAVRNIAIIAALALVLARLPEGDDVARAILALVTVIFLGMIAASAYVAYRHNRLAWVTLTDNQRTTILAALGGIVFVVAGTDEMLDTGLGTLAWFAVLGLAGVAIYRTVMAARSI